ncbi:hypothetical protein EVAR_56615_1 [Eumeta japonica]|uniref:Uncharacterized protein n=1 Tax=Eumeta variegata TaxID=151549 RepID=A0A4C1XL34_EUMVA|nr:hypothetical protein EVAR_56615_1 [Eumeta japonica]
MPPKHNCGICCQPKAVSDQLDELILDQSNRSDTDLKIYPRSKAVPSGQLCYLSTSITDRTVKGSAIWRRFVRGSSTPYLWLRVRDGGLMLPHARASSRRGYDPDGPVAMAPFEVSKLEDFSRPSEIKRSYQWVHRYRPRPSRPFLGVMVKWKGASTHPRRCGARGKDAARRRV